MNEEESVKEIEDTSVYKGISKELLHCFACDKLMWNGLVSHLALKNFLPIKLILFIL